jgi:glucosamine kinase
MCASILKKQQSFTSFRQRPIPVTRPPVLAEPVVLEGIRCLIGVDGGGTLTRARLLAAGCPASRPFVGEGMAGPSALGQGIAQAWRNIGDAVADAFAKAGEMPIAPAHCVIGLGLSGVHHTPWRDAFLAANPGYAGITVHPDSHAALIGAHGGQPGLIVIAGTGSVGEAMYADGTSARVGGWGFPSGDEGSGASLGLRAAQVAQFAMDGRGPAGKLAEAVLAVTGRSTAQLQAWCALARQFEYASLAPLVFDAELFDPIAAELLAGAVEAIEATLFTLDPAAELPLVMLGSIGRRLQRRLSPWEQARCVRPAGDAMDGALLLARQIASPPNLRDGALEDAR